MLAVINARGVERGGNDGDEEFHLAQGIGVRFRIVIKWTAFNGSHGVILDNAKGHFVSGLESTPFHREHSCRSKLRAKFLSVPLVVE